jgi:hypothetical protein
MPIYMYIEIQYYDLLALLSYYTVLFIESYMYCIIYIWTRSNARACTQYIKKRKTDGLSKSSVIMGVHANQQKRIGCLKKQMCGITHRLVSLLIDE